MSCNTCQTKFTFFTRESGCPVCGFSYCSKCLKYKTAVPHLGVKKVCGKCHLKIKETENSVQRELESTVPKIAANNEQAEPIASPPIDMSEKSIPSDNIARPAIVVYKQQTGRWDCLKSGLDSVDQQMVDRLRKLKDEDQSIPQLSSQEIQRRLALLQDRDPDKPIEKTNIYKADTRTDEQKTTDLLNEYVEELELTSENSPGIDQSLTEIEVRLARLRGMDPSKVLNKSLPENDEDEETTTRKIIESAIMEGVLESKCSGVGILEDIDSNSGVKASSEEELPWCVICNEDAQTRCLGCDGDLYCVSCFRQGHDSFEMVDHQQEPFKSSKSKHRIE